MTKGSAKFYDRFTFFYPLVDLFLKPQKRRFFGRINALPYGQALEIGVGNGAHFKYYRNHHITGIDTSQYMLLRARKHVTDHIRLIQMDGESLLFANESFDYVILSHVVAVVADPEKLFTEAHRVLKPGGKVFILNHFTPNNWLQYIDRAVERISPLFHFKSVFRKSSLNNANRFRLLSEFDAGLFSYFKILVYEKNV